MLRKTLPAIAALAVTLTGCSSGTAEVPSGSPVQTTVSPSAGLPAHTLPVAHVFGEPVWGMQIPPFWKMTPVVTAQRVIALDADNVLAFDAKGTEVWSTDWTPLAESDRIAGSPPLLRQVTSDVIAVIDTGKVKGEGLATTTYAARVTLINVEHGALIKEVSVPGSESDSPKLGSVGLGFALPDRTAVVVTPEGEIVEAPAAPADARLVGAASVGHHPIGLWETGSVNTLASFGASGWSSTDSLPDEKTVNGQVLGSDADSLVLGRWNEPAAGSGEAGEVAFQVVDAASGQTFGTLECGPAVAQPFVVSPSREWKVTGSLRLSPQNEGDCTGGGEGQRSVTFSAVTDEGRAFGLAGQGGSDALFVDSRPGEEPETSELPEGARPPIGVMEGGLAVHWESRTGIITANPLAD